MCSISLWCSLLLIIILLAMEFNVSCRIAYTDSREYQLLRMRVCLRYILIHITSTNISLLINQGSELHTYNTYLVSKHLEVFYPLNQVLLIARCLQIMLLQVIPKLCKLERTKIFCSPVNLIHWCSNLWPLRAKAPISNDSSDINCCT